MKAAAILFCFVLLFSCNKESGRSGLKDLNGNWELRVTDGGFSYEHNTYPNGNGNTLTFSGPNQFHRVIIIDGVSYIDSGTYAITKMDDCRGEKLKFISFSDIDPAFTLIVSVVGDSLYLKANGCVVADGVDRTYAKVN